MELFDRASHHAHKDLTIKLEFDKYGNPVEFKGRGFRHVNIYELIPAQTESARRKGRLRKIWVESKDRKQIHWEASHRWSGTLDQVIQFRNAAFPDARVVMWTEDDGFVLWDEPMTVISKRKRR